MRTRSACPVDILRGERCRAAVLRIAGLLYVLAIVLFPCAEAVAYVDEAQAAHTSPPAVLACISDQPAVPHGRRSGDTSCCVVESGAAIGDTRAIAAGDSPEAAAHGSAARLLLHALPVRRDAGAWRGVMPRTGIAIYLRNLRLLI